MTIHFLFLFIQDEFYKLESVDDSCDNSTAPSLPTLGCQSYPELGCQAFITTSDQTRGLRYSHLGPVARDA